MTPTHRLGLCKRCFAFVLVLMFCLAPLAALGSSTFGTVTANGLNLREGPSTSSRILTSFPRGTWVEVLETSGSWYRVRIGNWTGYMSANFVSLNNTAGATDGRVSGANGFINLRASASLTAPVLATFPNGTAVRILAREGNFFRVQVGNLTGYMVEHLVRPDSVNVVGRAVVRSANGGSVNLRTAPDMSASIIQSFRPGTQAEILQRSTTWHRVRIAGVTGFMRAEFLSTDGSGGGGGSTGNFGVVNNPRPTQVLNLRETPSLNARVLASYRNGRQVEILGTTGDWFRVRIDGMTGYMMRQFVRVGSTPNPSLPTTATLRNLNGGSIVNFRERPGLNSRILATHPVGTTVTVLSFYNVDWAQVSIGGVTGFVSRHFLRL